MCERFNEDQVGKEEILCVKCDCETDESNFEDIDDEEDSDLQNTEVDDDELPTIDELYGYDDPEDNAEAALDDVLKAQENS
jgi:hypothetical protein